MADSLERLANQLTFHLWITGAFALLSIATPVIGWLICHYYQQKQRAAYAIADRDRAILERDRQLAEQKQRLADLERAQTIDRAPANIGTVESAVANSLVRSTADVLHDVIAARAGRSRDRAGLRPTSPAPPLPHESSIEYMHRTGIIDEVHYPEPGQPVVHASFRPPALKLPRGGKAAFKSSELFAQQQNMQTFDEGMQHFLESLRAIVCQITGLNHFLRELDFTVNFSGAGTSAFKNYSIMFHRPLSGNLQLTQTVDQNMDMLWVAHYNGSRYVFQVNAASGLVMTQNGDVPPEQPELYHDREMREISLD